MKDPWQVIWDHVMLLNLLWGHTDTPMKCKRCSDHTLAA